MNEQTRSAEERLVGLLLALRHTERGMSATEILRGVPGYGSGNPDSERRKFERDKELLREMGITVTTTGEREEARYRISEADYALPELHLDASQAAALDLAASAWRNGSLPATATRALTKLRAVSEGLGEGPAALLGTELAADLSGEQIPEELIAAVDERRRVSFDYLSAHWGTTRMRVVEPHHLRMSRGSWYLDAVEAATGQERTFNLARLRGAVEVLGAPGAFERRPRPARAPHRAVLALQEGRALALRLVGEQLDDIEEARSRDGAAHPIRGALEGRDLIAVDYEDPLSFAGTLAALGEAVIVLEPAALRQAVLAHLRAAAALAPPAGPSSRRDADDTADRSTDGGADGSTDCCAEGA